MRIPLLALTVLAILFASALTASAQQIEMFPPGPYVAHCRALEDDLTSGGDDDHNNIYLCS